jgi:predicted ATPase/DNA-binding CsgD family transcriptional regulator
MALPNRQLSSLPTPLTVIIGRDHEIASVVAALDQHAHRLVTLTGPGGVGKTVLALAAGRTLEPVFRDGVRFVSLAPISDPDLVMPAIGRAVGVRDAGRHTISDRLVGHLKDKQHLLIIDNFEHVIEAAPGISDLLSNCPFLSVLSTSRMRLRLSGEREYPVPPLALPDSAAPHDFDGLAGFAAVQLFVERARALQPDFALSEVSVHTVAEICRRLDGLPLAIELAAARVTHLPLAALEARLERRLPILTGGPCDAPARQRTMRDTIAWSHDLLSPEEQVVFRRLAVFVGGCTLEAAGTVASNGADLLDNVGSLVTKSLLRQLEASNGEPRYRMLETVREYGLERLAESGEEVVIWDRHAAWCLSLAERYWVEEAAWAEDPAGWLARVEPEHHNVRAALAWLKRTGDGAGLLRLAGAMQPFWDVRGHRTEAVDWLERGLALGQGAPAQARLRALADLGRNFERQGYYAQAAGVHEVMLALAREHGDELWEARALHVLGLGALNQERYDEAAPLIEGAMAAYRRLGDEGGVCQGHYCSGVIAYGSGDLAAATAHLKAALAWRRNRGSVANLTVPLNALGLVACDRGDHRAATALLAEALTRWEQDGGRNGEVLAEWLAAVARLAANRGRPGIAGRLYGAAEALFDAVGLPLVVPPRSLYRRHVDILRDTLGPEAFATTWATGRELALEQAIEEARAVTADPIAAKAAPPAGALDVSPALTCREREVLHLLARGMTDREIADTLFISHRTVNSHVASILAKLGVSSRREVATLSRNPSSWDVLTKA